jgi:hypothetical protein
MSTNWRDEVKTLEQRLMVVQDHYAELAWALGSPIGGFWGAPTETHADILRRAEQLAKLDAFVAVHQYALDRNHHRSGRQIVFWRRPLSPTKRASVWWSGWRLAVGGWWLTVANDKTETSLSPKLLKESLL